jgi:hypothetical protein
LPPCGMNCNLCIARLREKRVCPGCRGGDGGKSVSCVRCAIKDCSTRRGIGSRHCSDRCPRFPCERLLGLDKRYRTRYGMSMVENLRYISANGVRAFIRQQSRRWIRGGKIFCVNKKAYYPME